MSTDINHVTAVYGETFPVEHKTATIEGVTMFYREAGPRDAPIIVLLHGFPSSSRMFATLFPLLSPKYRLVAPDLPGFGHSDTPPRAKFPYTFDHLAHCVRKLLSQLDMSRYTLYMQDYGGPIGFRLATANPEHVAALIVQNAVAHVEGLSEAWAIRKAFC